MKTIERLIICVVLMALAFVFGCKDETEAATWPKPDKVELVDCERHGESECIRYHDGFRECIYCKRYYGEFLRKNLVEIVRDTEFPEPEPNESEDETIFIEANTNVDDTIYCRWKDGIVGSWIEIYEPNEPEDSENFVVSNSLLKDFWKQPDWKEMATSVISYSMCCGKCGKDLSPYEYVTPNAHQCGVEPKPLLEMIIPTWPDYIELEKDLVLRYDFPEPNNPLLIHIPSEFRVISKGTKIYYKGKEE